MAASLPSLEAPLKHVFKCYILGKMQHFVFPKDDFVHARKLECVHNDDFGPMQTLYFGNHSYFVTFVDDHTHLCWVYLMTIKIEFKNLFKKFYTMVETQFKQKLEFIILTMAPSILKVYLEIF